MAWNHIAHIRDADLLFALGLRSSTSGDSSTAGGPLPLPSPSPSFYQGRRDVLRVRGTSHRCKSPSDDQGNDERDDSHSLSDGGTATVLKSSREDELEAMIAKRGALQRAFARQKKKHAKAAARLKAFEGKMDQRLQELTYITTSLREGEKHRASLQATLGEAKARCNSLQNALGYLSAERARLRGDMLRSRMPTHLRQSQGLRLPSTLREARDGLNFSSLTPSSRSRPHTVFAILEDGMPGGRLESRLESRFQNSQEAWFGGSSYPETMQAIVSTPKSAGVALGSMSAPTSGCFSGMGKRPPLRLLQPVSPIQSAGYVGDVEAFEEEVLSRTKTRGARYRHPVY